MHALVTGATRGIGRRTALALADAGLDVAVTGRTVHEGDGRVTAREPGDHAPVPVPGSLETTAQEIEERGRRCLPIELDLRSVQSVHAAAATLLATWGAPAVLVNNAIVHEPHARFLDHDPAVLAATWTGNFLHQYVLTQALLPAMLEAGGGLLVDVVSSSAVHDPPGPPGGGGWGLAYAASKAAFGRIAGAVNAEYADQGLLAFNVDPGFVVTEAGAARGGNAAINDAGFPSADPGAVGAVAVWLLTAGDEERRRFLGKTIWAPALLERLGRTTEEEGG
jgi:NAD(P)-dependent dehydrogenase (short-subunit alcohol dehydrogenase family)